MKRWLLALCVTFGVGYLRPAPGTWGSLLAFPMVFAMFFMGGSTGYVILPLTICFLLVLGIVASHYYMKVTGRHDPKEVIIDEIVGQMLTLQIALPVIIRVHSDPKLLYGWLFGCFLAFRLFDIVKMGPVKYFDQKEGAVGVMMDDVCAGVIAGSLVLIIAWCLGVFHV